MKKIENASRPHRFNAQLMKVNAEKIFDLIKSNISNEETRLVGISKKYIDFATFFTLCLS